MKKLFLNKQTIAKLNNLQQLHIRGGETGDECEQDPTECTHCDCGGETEHTEAVTCLGVTCGMLSCEPQYC